MFKRRSREIRSLVVQEEDLDLLIQMHVIAKFGQHDLAGGRVFYNALSDTLFSSRNSMTIAFLDMFPKCTEIIEAPYWFPRHSRNILIRPPNPYLVKRHEWELRRTKLTCKLRNFDTGREMNKWDTLRQTMGLVAEPRVWLGTELDRFQIGIAVWAGDDQQDAEDSELVVEGPANACRVKEAMVEAGLWTEDGGFTDE